MAKPGVRLQTPLAKAQYLGSAKDGAGHWWAERISALGLVPLTFWFIYFAVVTAGQPYDVMRQWLHAPLTAILLILMTIATFYHAALGSQVILEDYVGHEGLRRSIIVFVQLAFFALAVACIYAIMKIGFGA